MTSWSTTNLLPCSVCWSDVGLPWHGTWPDGQDQKSTESTVWIQFHQSHRSWTDLFLHRWGEIAAPLYPNKHMVPATSYILRAFWERYWCKGCRPVTSSERFHTVTVWSSFKGRETLVTFREVLGTFRVQLLQNIPIMTTEPSAPLKDL